jgi:hypothetical protein
MALSMWTNAITGQRLEADELRQLRARAHRLYEVNPHIFEDEREALVALGAEPPIFALPTPALAPLPLAAA